MDRPYLYEIRVEGQLAEQWSDWFEGLSVTRQEDGGTLIGGSIPDQAALFAVLGRIYDLNLVLVSVQRAAVEQRSQEEPSSYARPGDAAGLPAGDGARVACIHHRAGGGKGVPLAVL